MCFWVWHRFWGYLGLFHNPLILAFSIRHISGVSPSWHVRITHSGVPPSWHVRLIHSGVPPSRHVRVTHSGVPPLRHIRLILSGVPPSRHIDSIRVSGLSPFVYIESSPRSIAQTRSHVNQYFIHVFHSLRFRLINFYIVITVYLFRSVRIVITIVI